MRFIALHNRRGITEGERLPAVAQEDILVALYDQMQSGSKLRLIDYTTVGPRGIRAYVKNRGYETPDRWPKDRVFLALDVVHISRCKLCQRTLGVTLPVSIRV